MTYMNELALEVRPPSQSAQLSDLGLQAQEVAAEALEFNKTLFAALPIGVLTYTASGQCVSANEAAERILGGDSRQLRAQNFRELESWKRSGLLHAAESALATGSMQELEVHLETAFGKELWLRCHCARFH